MSRKALIRTVTTVAVVAGVLGPASAGLAAPPSRAPIQCCGVGLGDVPIHFVAGGMARSFTAGFRNHSRVPIEGLQLIFTFGVTGPKMPGGQIHLQRRIGDGWHTVNVGRHGNVFTGTDSVGASTNVAPGGLAHWQYQMWFGSRAPTATVTISLAASGRGDGFRRTTLANSRPYQTSVTAVPPVTASTPPAPTPSAAAPSQTPSQASTTDGQSSPVTVVQAPSAAAGTPDAVSGGSGIDSGSFMWLAYTLGALLLLAGIAVIGTMLWRRGPQFEDAAWEGGYPEGPEPAAGGGPDRTESSWFTPVHHAAPPAAPVPAQRPPSDPYEEPVPVKFTPTEYGTPAPWPDRGAADPVDWTDRT
jgi:hypothetical protein